MLSSGGASQPAGGTVDVHVGCFNTGIDQRMLRSQRHLDNFKRIQGKGFAERDLHLLGLCEVGGHKQGLNTLGIYSEDLID